jgi:hypothetical protein
MRLRMRIRLRGRGGIRSPGHAANRQCPLGHPQGMPHAANRHCPLAPGASARSGHPPAGGGRRPLVARVAIEPQPGRCLLITYNCSLAAIFNQRPQRETGHCRPCGCTIPARRWIPHLQPAVNTPIRLSTQHPGLGAHPQQQQQALWLWQDSGQRAALHATPDTRDKACSAV